MTGATATAGHDASTESDSTTHETRAAELRRAMPQWLDAAAGVAPGPARNPSLPTLVGLLILILCFFVVLTSISLRDQNRENSVMASLSQAFSNRGMAPSSDQPVSEEQTRKLLGDLQAQLHAEVPLVSGVAPASSDDYVLNLPRNLVLAEDGTVASGFAGILGRAMGALKTGPADFAYEIEVALSAPQMDDTAIKSATAVAAALREAGFANDTAAVSLQPGSGAAVSLTIRLRPNARLAPAGQP